MHVFFQMGNRQVRAQSVEPAPGNGAVVFDGTPCDNAVYTTLKARRARCVVAAKADAGDALSDVSAYGTN
jgi:hypothetical protein